MPRTANMKKVVIAADNMVDLMANINREGQDPTGKKVGARFVTIIAKTTPKLTAGNPFSNGVRKLSKVQMNLGVSYAACVKAQLAREGKPADFKAEKRAWGESVDGTPFVVHTNKPSKTTPSPEPKLYLSGKVERSVEYWYEDPSGNEIPKDQVTPWLPKRSASRQGTGKEVIWRNYGLDKVLGFIFGGQIWVVEDNLTLLKDLMAIRG